MTDNDKHSEKVANVRTESQGLMFPASRANDGAAGNDVMGERVKIPLITNYWSQTGLIIQRVMADFNF